MDLLIGSWQYEVRRCPRAYALYWYVILVNIGYCDLLLPPKLVPHTIPDLRVCHRLLFNHRLTASWSHYCSVLFVLIDYINVLYSVMLLILFLFFHFLMMFPSLSPWIIAFYVLSIPPHFLFLSNPMDWLLILSYEFYCLRIIPVDL